MLWKEGASKGFAQFSSNITASVFILFLKLVFVCFCSAFQASSRLLLFYIYMYSHQGKISLVIDLNIPQGWLLDCLDNIRSGKLDKQMILRSTK